MSLVNCRLIDLPELKDSRGSLSFVEAGRQVPFLIRRIYYLYGVPLGAVRGGHAHKELHQLMIAMHGSFEILIDDGINKSVVALNNPARGLYICPMIWRELRGFSGYSVCVVLASEVYNEDDYLRNYSDFLGVRKGG